MALAVATAALALSVALPAQGVTPLPAAPTAPGGDPTSTALVSPTGPDPTPEASDTAGPDPTSGVSDTAGPDSATSDPAGPDAQASASAGAASDGPDPDDPDLAAPTPDDPSPEPSASQEPQTDGAGAQSPGRDLRSAVPGDVASAAPADRAWTSVDCSRIKCVALTFDDGPGARTPDLLATLKKLHVKATFFMLGERMRNNPKFTRSIAAAGHEIGNHSWDHESLTGLDAAALAKEIGDTADVAQELTGTRPRLLRPPYGNYDDAVKAAAHGPLILWDVDTEDWKNLSEKVTTSRALTAQPGDIILMHDIHSWSVDAVPGIVKKLKKKGYRFVTVSELLGPDGSRSGVVYSNGPHPIEAKKTEKKD